MSATNVPRNGQNASSTAGHGSEAPAGGAQPDAGKGRSGRNLGPAAGLVAGVVAGAVGLAISELLAGLVPGVPSLAIEIGTLVVALQPPGAKDVVVAVFGTNDKLALDVGVALAALAVAAVGGLLARHDFRRGMYVFGGIGLVGVVACVLDPLASPVLGLVVAALAVAGALATLRIRASLCSSCRRRTAARSGSLSER